MELVKTITDMTAWLIENPSSFQTIFTAGSCTAMIGAVLIVARSAKASGDFHRGAGINRFDHTIKVSGRKVKIK